LILQENVVCTGGLKGYKRGMKEYGKKVTGDDALKDLNNNLREATELYLEEFPLKEERKTLLTTFEVGVSAKA